MAGKDTFCFSVRPHAPRHRPCRFAPRASFRLRVHCRPFTLELWFAPGRGYSPASLTRLDRGGVATTILYLPVKVTTVKKPIPQATQGTGPIHLAPVESRVFTGLGNIVAHLAEVRYDDGSPRQPGTLFIRTMGGAWQVTATAPDAQCRLPVVANTLDDALAGLDLLLGAADAPWEIDPYAKARADKQGKKKS